MAHRSLGLLAGLLLIFSVSARAADEIPAGNYKFSFTQKGQTNTFWILKLSFKDGKWTGEVVAKQAAGVPDLTVSDIKFTPEQVTFTIDVKDNGKFTFEGKLPPDGKKINGSLDLGAVVPASLELTTLTSLDPFDVAKETIARPNATGPEIIDAALALVRQAGEKKAKPEEVRGWVSKATKAAEAHGHRFQLDTTLRITDALAKQDDFAAEAVQYGRQAERLLGPGDKRSVRYRTLNTLASALKATKKDEDAKEAKDLEEKAEKAVSLQPVKFAGRKGKSDRLVVVELFTGTECPPCVAADLAFDALSKTYSPKEVALLEYHLHIPRPDPLTNQDSIDRQEYYDLESTPSLFLNGKSAPAGGGGKANAPDAYEDFVAAINPLLETETKVEVKVTAAQKDNKIEITGNVSGVAEPSDKLRLRFVLVEDEVKYKAGNKLDTFTSVVRDMPGGAKGFAVKEKTFKQTTTVDLDELRKKLKEYIADLEKQGAPFSSKERPLDLKKLRVIALVQNDETKEILQAAQVDVKSDKAE